MGFQVIDLHFSHPKRASAEHSVLARVDATFPKGAVSLVTGKNGAGKTTLFHLLAGLLRPNRGEVLAGGEPVSRWTAPHKDRWRRQVGIVFQHLCLFEDLTALENVMLPAVPRTNALKILRQHSTAALDKLGVSRLASRLAAELSGGERQRVALARAAAHSPRYLIADEVFSHQDDTGRKLTAEALRQLAEAGTTVLVSDPNASADWAQFVFRLRNKRLEQIR